MSLIGKWEVDEGAFEGQSFTINPPSGQSGTWSSAFDVLAVAIKGGPNFLLVDYTMDGAVNGDVWCTDGSCSIGGNFLPVVLNGSGMGPADLSHLSLYGSLSIPPAVPEPGTWLMLILGFALIGSAVRQRQVKTLV